MSVKIKVSDRKVIVPKDKKICGKCGAPLGFYKNERGNYVPCNLDGGDHWDDCRADQVTGKYGKQYKKQFRVYRIGAYTKPVGKKDDQYYDGDIPPWEFEYFIHCVCDKKELLSKEYTYSPIDTEIGWTDGTIERH